MDWINDKVYFSFGAPSPDHLVMYDISTGMQNEIIISPVPASYFYDLAVDPIAGYVLL